MNRKIIVSIIICGLILGSVSVYAGTKFYASDVSVNVPTGSNLGSNANLQNALDDLYNKINSYTKKYENGTAVYYNPTTGEKCTSSSAVSTTGTKTGCMKWYTFNDSEGSSSVNLILDHNTTAIVQWNSSGNNSEMNEVAKALSNDTKDWVVGSRLIKAEEVATIVGNTSFNKSNSFYLVGSSPSTGKGVNKYSWLFDYTHNCINNGGCSIEDNKIYIVGYWTSTPYINSSINTYYVSMYGQVDYQVTNARGDMGVRPVITIAKSIIK